VVKHDQKKSTNAYICGQREYVSETIHTERSLHATCQCFGDRRETGVWTLEFRSRIIHAGEEGQTRRQK
jgi:hypothetical protein